MKRCSFAALALMTPSVAHAQSMPSIWIGDMAVNSAVLGQAVDSSARTVRTFKAPEISQRRSRDASSLRYVPTSQRTAANLASFVEKTAAVDPQGAEGMSRIFSSGNVIGQISEGMKEMGLRSDNVADAYALWWMLAWAAANQQEATEDISTARAVQTQSAQALLSTPAFAGLDDAGKQNLAETLIVQAMLVDAASSQYASDPKMRSKVAKAVNQGAQRMGLDLTKMELTESGFVMREGASAADGPALPGDKPEALATADVVDDEGERLETYALPALGGAAALAAVFLLGRSAGRRG